MTSFVTRLERSQHRVHYSSSFFFFFFLLSSFLQVQRRMFVATCPITFWSSCLCAIWQGRVWRMAQYGALLWRGPFRTSWLHIRNVLRTTIFDAKLSRWKTRSSYRYAQFILIVVVLSVAHEWTSSIRSLWGWKIRLLIGKKPTFHILRLISKQDNGGRGKKMFVELVQKCLHLHCTSSGYPYKAYVMMQVVSVAFESLARCAFKEIDYCRRF